MRERRGLALLEGQRAVATALDVPEKVRLLVMTDAVSGHPDADRLRTRAEASGIPVRVVPAGEVVEYAATDHPSGFLAVLAWAPRRLPGTAEVMAEIERRAPEQLLCLDRVADPGNLGTLLRTADAFGVGGVVLGRGCVEATNPKVVRSAVGSLLSLPWIVEDVVLPELLPLLHDHGWLVLRAEASSGDSPGPPRPGRPWVLVLGSEAHGTDPRLLTVGQGIHIPIKGSAGSLNVSVAGGILLHLLTRERMDRDG
jgi:TrmH family RNA methyltransferase